MHSFALTRSTTRRVPVIWLCGQPCLFCSARPARWRRGIWGWGGGVFMGMGVAIRSNIRTASAVTKDMNSALQTALRGGAVSGFFVVALSLLGVAGLFTLIRNLEVATDVTKIPLLMVGYGFGASFVGLFAQLGGG